MKKKGNPIKRFFRWCYKQFVWFTSDKVLEAINQGKTPEEVEKIVEEEMKR